jgi:eukaryotic-like serine/threonine-protein kinase
VTSKITVFMTPERYQQVKELFQSALEREGSQRKRFLAEACAGDPSLREEVESLLTSHEEAPSFIESSALEIVSKVLPDQPDKQMVGQRIGPYKVIREIAHGGMGAVYLAFRADDEYQKQVAIKLIKRGMDTDSIIRRFRNERQILANLDHPNIARLIDGGTTEDGLTYFIMDHVEGLPIDAYCDAHKLSIVERLKLFRTVCSAVEYAHQHHVIHRDLKPSNIFVTVEGVPKLLDFGIAKVLNPEPPFQTVESVGLGPMTPDYASPEQVRGETITPASDVYSLGVLLYELLTGHRPYRIKSRTPQEIERVICEEEPERPSRAIGCIEEVPGSDGTSEITITPESVSATRDGQSEKLRRYLAGDVDKILLMALCKESERRYLSVEEFSEDIRRHLEGQPVIARKDALYYRSTKFIKRNKATFVAVALTAVILVIVATAVSLLTARSQIASIAVLPFVNASADPNMEYLSDGITETLMNKLSQLPNLKVLPRTSVFHYKGKEPDPQAVGKSLNVQAVVTGKVVHTDDSLSISAELVDVQHNRHLWGDRYTRKLAEILVLQEEITRQIADQLRTRLSGEEKKRLAKRYTENTEAYQLYLKGRYFWNKRTEKDLKKAIEYFEQTIAIDPTYALAYAGLADSYALFGFSLYAALSPREADQKAESAALKALEIDDTLAEAHTALGLIQFRSKWNWLKAESEFKRAIELNPNYALAYQYYALVLASMERQDEALITIKRAQELEPVSFILNAAVARHLYWAGQYDQAIEQLRKTLELDPNFMAAHFRLGLVYEQKGMYEEAIAEFSKAKTISENNPFVIAGLGHVYGLSGNRKKAQELIFELKELSNRRYVSAYDMAVIYSGLGERDQAFAWLEKAYQERAGSLVYLKVEPVFDPIRSDRRFADLLRRVGILDQLAVGSRQ